MGSFKDVFDLKESTSLIEGLILDVIPDIDITKLSIADGGEYSHEVILENIVCDVIQVDNVLTPYKTETNSSYLIFEDGSVFISSSHILRILPENDDLKNPLNLTSFGLGQLIKDAIDKGARNIFIGLGGTNTVDAGIGMLQALGVQFQGRNKKQLYPVDGKYFSGSDLQNIQDIDYESLKKKYKNISIISICDGNIGIDEMQIPNNQKIGNKYYLDKDYINEVLTIAINRYSEMVSRRTNLVQNFKQPFYGVAGGINISLKCLFHTDMKSGIDYFINITDLGKKVQEADLVITGEGKLDNSLGGKTPIGISKLAKIYGKPVLYMVGSVSKELEKYFVGDISYNFPLEIKQNGVSAIISCHNYNANANANAQRDKNSNYDTYRTNTPIVFKKALKEYLLENGYGV